MDGGCLGPMQWDQRRARSHRIDDQIKRSFPLAIIKHQLALLQRHDAARGGDLDAGLYDRIMQHIEQGGAVHRIATRITERRIAHIQHHAPRGRAEQPVNARTEVAHALPQPKPVEHRQSRGLQDEAGTHRLGRIELLEYCDGVTRPVQSESGAEACRPSSANRNRKVVHAPALRGRVTFSSR